MPYFLEKYCGLWCKGCKKPALQKICFHITGYAPPKGVLPHSSLFNKRRLSYEQYHYCARDPALSLFLLHIYAFARKGSIVLLSELKGYFAGSIQKEKFQFGFDNAPDHVLYMDRNWG